MALRNGANINGNLKDTSLSDFCRRIELSKLRVLAISGTARKLTVIIWNMLAKKVFYKEDTAYEFLDRKRKVQEMKKLITKFDLKADKINLQL